MSIGVFESIFQGIKYGQLERISGSTRKWRSFEAAADASFEVVLSIDKKLEHEQNLQTLPIPVVVIDSLSNALPSLMPFAAALLELLNSPLNKMLYIVQSAGTTLRLTVPRR